MGTILLKVLKRQAPGQAPILRKAVTGLEGWACAWVEACSRVKVDVQTRGYSLAEGWVQEKGGDGAERVLRGLAVWGSAGRSPAREACHPAAEPPGPPILRIGGGFAPFPPPALAPEIPTPQLPRFPSKVFFQRLPDGSLPGDQLPKVPLDLPGKPVLNKV